MCAGAGTIDNGCSAPYAVTDEMTNIPAARTTYSRSRREREVKHQRAIIFSLCLSRNRFAHDVNVFNIECATAFDPSKTNQIRRLSRSQDAATRSKTPWVLSRHTNCISDGDSSINNCACHSIFKSDARSCE